MYEARQRKEKVSRRIGGGVPQRAKMGKYEEQKDANTEIKFCLSNKVLYNSGLIQLLKEKTIQKVKLKLPIQNGDAKIYDTEKREDIVYIKNWIDYQYENRNIDALNSLVIKLLSKDYKNFLFTYAVYRIESLRNSVNQIPKQLPPPPPPPTQLFFHGENQNKDLKSSDTKKMTLWDIYKQKYNFTDEEISALQIYTTKTYMLINKYLRFKDSLSEDVKEQIIDFVTRIDFKYETAYDLDGNWDNTCRMFKSFIDLIISGMAKWKQPNYRYVSRGVKLNGKETENLRNLHEKKGTVITEPGFLSTSFGIPFAKDSIVIIRLPKGEHQGRDVSEFSAYNVENELLFPPNTQYQIKSIIKKGTQEFESVLKWLIPTRDKRFDKVENIYVSKLVKK